MSTSLTLAQILVVSVLVFLLYGIVFALVRLCHFVAFHENRIDRENAFSNHLDWIYRKSNGLPKCTPGACYCRRTCKHVLSVLPRHTERLRKPFNDSDIPY